MSYFTYPTLTASGLSSAAFPLSAPNGAAGTPSYSFGGGTGGAGTGLYATTTNTMAFATNSTFAGSIDANQQWIHGTANASALRHAFFKDANAGDTTTILGLYIGNSGSSQGVMRFEWTNAAATGSPSSLWTHRPRNNANNNDINAARIAMYKEAASDQGRIDFSTNDGSNLNTVLSINGSGLHTIGATGGTQRHRFNSGTATPAAVALTISNGPTGTSGNPAAWIQFNINGTNMVIPAWSGA